MKISQLTEGPCDVAKSDDIKHMSSSDYEKYTKWKADCEDELRRTPLSGKRFTDNEQDFRKTMKKDEGTTVSVSRKPTPKVVPVSAEVKAKADAQNKASDAKLIKKAPIKDVNRKRNYNDDGIQPPKGHHNTTANRWAESEETNEDWSDVKNTVKKGASAFWHGGAKFDKKGVKFSSDLRKPKAVTKKPLMQSETYDDYHDDMSKEEYDKTVKNSEMEYTVWVGGTEVNDNWLNYEDAVALYDKYKAQGYDDVQLDARIKQEIPQDIPMGIRPYPKGVTEKAKPDFLDLDKDGDKKEPMKKAGKTKKEVCAKNEGLSSENEFSKIEISEDTINEFGPDEVYTKIGGTTAIANKKTGSIRAHGKIGGATLNVNNHLNKDGSSGQISGSGKIGNTNYNVSSKGHDTSLGLDGNFGGKRIQSQYTSNRVANKGRVNAPGTPIVPNKIDKTSLTHKIDGVNATDKQVVKHLNKSLKSENEFSKKVKEATDADAAAIKDRDDFIKMVSARPKSSNKAIDSIKKIVADKQNMQVKFDDGKMKVDLYTASAVSAVYDALKPETQEKVDNMLRTKEGMLKLSNFAFSKLNEGIQRIQEGKGQRIDEWIPLVIGAARVLGPLVARQIAKYGGKQAVKNMPRIAKAVSTKGKLKTAKDIWKKTPLRKTGAALGALDYAMGPGLLHTNVKNTWNNAPQNALTKANKDVDDSIKRMYGLESKTVYSKDGELITEEYTGVDGVPDRNGKMHNPNSPKGKMIINMKKKNSNSDPRDKNGDGKDDKTGKPLDKDKNRRRGAILKKGADMAVTGGKKLGKMTADMMNKSGVGNPFDLKSSKYSPEDKSIEMMKEAMKQSIAEKGPGYKKNAKKKKWGKSPGHPSGEGKPSKDEIHNAQHSAWDKYPDEKPWNHIDIRF